MDIKSRLKQRIRKWNVHPTHIPYGILRQLLGDKVCTFSLRQACYATNVVFYVSFGNVEEQWPGQASKWFPCRSLVRALKANKEQLISEWGVLLVRQVEVDSRMYVGLQALLLLVALSDILSTYSLPSPCLTSFRAIAERRLIQKCRSFENGRNSELTRRFKTGMLVNIQIAKRDSSVWGSRF